MSAEVNSTRDRGPILPLRRLMTLHFCGTEGRIIAMTKHRIRALVVSVWLASSSAQLSYAAGSPPPIPNVPPVPANLATEWWQHLLSFPFGQDPASDSTGALCQVGQRGGIWFLYGTWGGPIGSPTVERECAIPAGKLLFFPVFNYFNLAATYNDGSSDSVRFLRDQLAGVVALTDVLEVTLDGARLPAWKIQRLISGPTEVTLAEDNLFDSAFPVAGGIYKPMVTDGHWSLLGPLAVGDHTLEIHGGSTALGSELHVLYTLHVIAPLPLPTDFDPPDGCCGRP